MPLMHIKTDQGNFAVPGDRYTHAMQHISTVHQRIHAGQCWDLSAKMSIGTGATALLLGKVGQYGVHFQHFSVQSTDGPIDIELFEAPTTTADGTLQTIRNRNREFADDSATFGVYLTPTVTVDGDRLFITGVLADAALIFGASTTAEQTQKEEWVLEPSTNYLIKLTNNGSGTAVIYTNFMWYEQV